jgi:hypothetical protein
METDTISYQNACKYIISRMSVTASEAKNTFYTKKEEPDNELFIKGIRSKKIRILSETEIRRLLLSRESHQHISVGFIPCFNRSDFEKMKDERDKAFKASVERADKKAKAVDEILASMRDTLELGPGEHQENYPRSPMAFLKTIYLEFQRKIEYTLNDRVEEI